MPGKNSESLADLKALCAMRNDQLEDAGIHLNLIAEALGVEHEPHQTYLQRIVEAARTRGSLSRFFYEMKELEMQCPFLYVELARHNVTDWMVHVHTRPTGGKVLAQFHGQTAEDACEAALEHLMATGIIKE